MSTTLARVHSLLLSSGARMLFIQLGSRVLALLLSIFLARTLGLFEYGRYAFAFALVSLVAVVAEFGLPLLLERTVATEIANRRWDALRGLLLLLDRWGLAHQRLLRGPAGSHGIDQLAG